MKKALISVIIIIAWRASVAQILSNQLQFWRPYDQNGQNIFEPVKQDTVPFDGLRLRIGGNTTQQFQSLQHSNDADALNNANGVNVNELADIGSGFNLATANLNLDVQLADGIRMNITTYLSSRHHPETWVKGGYVQIDKLPFFQNHITDRLMQFLTIRLGHMEINYGDAHFRRTDNGNAFYNPFIGNYLMDAFTTEIGAELYFQSNGCIAMAGATNGEINGMVTNPAQRSPSFYGKLGYDNQLSEVFRFRITGSAYLTNNSINNTLYSGDRTGSRYYMVLENTLASTSSNFTSGRINPGFRDKVTAFVIHPFVKFGGLEFFGTVEQAMGRNSVETSDRVFTQLAGDVVYRFGKNEKMYVAVRYNRVNGELAGISEKVTVERIQAGAGWFITENILAKIEYVDQQYKDYPSFSIFHDGKFNGIMAEGVIAF